MRRCILTELILIILSAVLLLTACGRQETSVDPPQETQKPAEEAIPVPADTPSPADTPALPEQEKHAALRFDGIYCCIRENGTDGLLDNYAIRFFEDGTVIDATVSQSEKDGAYFPRASWFNQEDSRFIPLPYTLTDTIRFTTEQRGYGTVDYEGKVLEDRLLLDLHSNINGNEEKDMEYVFYPFDQIPGWYD